MKTRWQAFSNGHWLQVWELRQRRVEEAGLWRPISLLLCGMALLLGIQNPLLYGMAPGFDASLFAAMGKMWADGDVLYRDMLDIKGPVIFLLDAIGYKLGGFPGMALLETALLAWGLNNSYRALALLGIAPLARLAAPSRSDTAPVNAPLTWPKISLSIRSLGIAPQLRATKALLARWLA